MQKTNSPFRAQTACPMCGNSEVRPISNLDGKTGGLLLTVQCEACGLGRIDPLPTPKELSDWYSNHYRQDYKGNEQPQLRHVLRAGRNALNRWKWFSERAACLQQFEGHPPKSLDIGASSGEFVYLLKRMGIDAQGIEPHTGYAAYARDNLGLTIHNGTLHERLRLYAENSLQLVSMFHVLEHLVDPLQTLRTIASKLGTNGMLFIEVPNAIRFCSPRYMFFRAHTLYFTAASLHQLLTAAGYRIAFHNAPNDDNLIVVAIPDLSIQVPAWQPNQALLAAQKRRKWLPYLWHQLRHARPLEKIARRREEKRTGAEFANGKTLLDALYLKNLTDAPVPRGANCATLTDE